MSTDIQKKDQQQITAMTSEVVARIVNDTIKRREGDVRNNRRAIAETIHKQTENEWYFAACLLAGSADIAVRECSWLRPDMLHVAEISEVWSDILNKTDPIQAFNCRGNGFMQETMFKVAETPNVVRPQDYARAIAEAYYYSHLIQDSAELVRAAHRRDVVQVRAIIDRLAAGELEGQSRAYDAGDLADDLKAYIQAGPPRYVETNILDDLIGGLFADEMTILAGRPGTGKTAICLDIARQVAFGGKKVLVASLEMAKRVLWARLACGPTGHTWEDMRTGKLDMQAMADIHAQSEKLRKRLGGNLIVDDEAMSVDAIHLTAATHKPDLVIVDHLGEVLWHDVDAKDIDWYGAAAKYLRDNIARRMHIPVVLIHQLSRNVEHRNDKRPVLSDLRQDGKLEQIADVVIMLYREDLYDIDKYRGATVVPMEVIVRKNRNGGNQNVKTLDYDLRAQTFS